MVSVKTYMRSMLVVTKIAHPLSIERMRGIEQNPH